MTVAAALERASLLRPDAPALMWDGGRMTHGELSERVSRVAEALARSSVRPGDRLALSAPNGWPYVVALLGCLRAGAAVAPLDPLLRDEERAAILEDLHPIPIDPLALVDAHVSGGRASTPAPANIALILYTSGSTGKPKGAVHGHAGVLLAAEAWAGPMMQLTPDDVVLAAVPLSHAYGIMGALLAPLLAGASVALLPRFDPDTALAALTQHRVTVLPGVATLFRRLLDAPSFSRDALASLRVALSGTAPCTWELATEWRERAGVRIVRGYGSTELFRPISYHCDDTEDDPGAIGRPAPGVDVRLGDDGELLIRTPCALLEYWDSPEATSEVLADGWYATGDLAEITERGLVRIVGRKRERILRGGYSVFPQEVEAVLATHPAVAEAAVAAIPHPELGEEVAGYVALRPGASATADELIAFCRDRLAAYKYPRRITFVDALPRTATGKVQRGKLGVSGHPDLPQPPHSGSSGATI
jgi:long-chain acyl-CoA synthetase